MIIKKTKMLELPFRKFYKSNYKFYILIKLLKMDKFF